MINTFESVQELERKEHTFIPIIIGIEYHNYFHKYYIGILGILSRNIYHPRVRIDNNDNNILYQK